MEIRVKDLMGLSLMALTFFCMENLCGMLLYGIGLWLGTRGLAWGGKGRGWGGIFWVWKCFFCSVVKISYLCHTNICAACCGNIFDVSKIKKYIII